jgi:hypothetical protein
MPDKIFVNYRRDDTRDVAARIRDRLANTFGETNVFMDVDNLLAGQRFDRELEKALAETEVFLAVIGPRWMELLAERQSSGEHDYVREEIAGALKRGIVVIPVLVEQTPLPRADALSEDIRHLVLHQKHVVTHEQFGRDVAGLVEAIRFPRKAGVRGLSTRWALTAAAVVVVAGAALYLTGQHSNDVAKPKVDVTTKPAADTAPPKAPGPVPAPPVRPHLTEAAEAWTVTKDTTNIPGLEAFIRRFGDTYYGDLAKVRLAELKQLEVAAKNIHTGDSLPESISLADLFPEPGDQRRTSTAVAWAVAHARSYYNAFSANAASRPGLNETVSPAYLYNLMYSNVLRYTGRSCEMSGTNLKTAFDQLRKHGALSLAEYGIDNLCGPFREDADARAARNKIVGTKTLISGPASPAEATSATTSQLDKVRQQLAAGNPVVFGIRISEAFQSLKPGTVYDKTTAELKDPKEDLHAMVVIGYDDRRRAFYVINSWGRSWGDGGYAWISYRSFLADVVEAYIMDVGKMPPRPVPSRPVRWYH